MSGKKTSHVIRSLPAAASLLTLTVAATIRVQHSCSEQPASPPPAVYPYPEIMVQHFLRDSYCRRALRIARAGAPSCPPTFIGNTIKS